MSRCTRAASRRAAAAAALPPCRLEALSHDELMIVARRLSNPLDPSILVSLSSTSESLREPLRPLLTELKEQRARTKQLYAKVYFGRNEDELSWRHVGLTASHVKTLAMLLRAESLRQVKELELGENNIGDEGMKTLCEALGAAALPRLQKLYLHNNKFGSAGVSALAAALGRGALPSLRTLHLSSNPIGDQGLARLAPMLRRLPALKELFLQANEIGDESVAALVGKPKAGEWPALEGLSLGFNSIGDAGCATLTKAIDSGALPALKDQCIQIQVWDWDACAVSQGAASRLKAAAARRGLSAFVAHH